MYRKTGAEDRKRTKERGMLALAALTAVLPFAAREACAAALEQGLRLCAGPLLLALFPFLIVSTLFARCGAAESMGWLLRPITRAMGFRAPCSGGILLMGLTGGFAPAANATAQCFDAGQIDAEEAADLLPACIGSGPSFVILSVGAGMLGSAALGVRLFAAQVLAGCLTAGILRRARRKKRGRKGQTVQAREARPNRAAPPAKDRAELAPLTQVIADAAMTYLRLCGFILYFRFLAGGLGALLPERLRVYPAMLLEVCSGCALAAQAGRWASWLCCAALSLQGASALLQVRALCPKEISFGPLLAARVLHLPLALGLFRLMLPGGTADVFSTLPARVIPRVRVPADCALLAFFGCCFVACRLCRVLTGRADDPKRANP
jgi:hypothetical protein